MYPPVGAIQADSTMFANVYFPGFNIIRVIVSYCRIKRTCTSREGGR